MQAAYVRCRRCEGVGTLECGDECPACEGYGGFWIVPGPGISFRLIPGDRQEKPEEPP